MKKAILLLGLGIMGIVFGLVTWKATEAITGIDAPMFALEYADCDRQAYLAAVLPLAKEHSDIFQSALLESPSDLQTSMDQLLQIRQEVDALVDSDTCEDLQRANTFMLNAIDNGIAALNARINGESNSVINEFGYEGADWIRKFHALVLTWQ